MRVQAAPFRDCSHSLGRYVMIHSAVVVYLILLVLEHITLEVCDCYTAPATLLRAGLFPCTPLLPSLAVDVELLEFVNLMFLNMPPNNTALSETLEAFLATRKYKLRTKVGLQPMSRAITDDRRILCASASGMHYSGTGLCSTSPSCKSTRGWRQSGDDYATERAATTPALVAFRG